jgi:hypothetical protein
MKELYTSMLSREEESWMASDFEHEIPTPGCIQAAKTAISTSSIWTTKGGHSSRIFLRPWTLVDLGPDTAVGAGYGYGWMHPNSWTETMDLVHRKIGQLARWYTCQLTLLHGAA